MYNTLQTLDKAATDERVIHVASLVSPSDCTTSELIFVDTLRQKATIHQVTTTLAGAQPIINVSGKQYRLLASSYDLENMTFLEVTSMMVTWWLVFFFVQ